MDSHIENLPDDILYIIFRMATFYRFPFNTDVWKRRLSLLAVSSRWRLVALPLVYSFARVVCGTPPQQQVGYKDYADVNNISINETNIRFIADMGHLQFIRYMYISVTYGHSPTWAVTKVVHELSSYMEQWPNIKVLAFDMSYYLSNGQAFICSASERNMIPQLIANIYTLLPNITLLELGRFTVCNYIYGFFGNLVDKYSRQLLKLDFKESPVTQRNTQLKMLRNLKYTFTLIRFIMPPSINPQHLVTMCISQMPLNFMWSPFYPSDAEAPIVFANLRKLIISYSTPWETRRNNPELVKFGGRKFRLEFPSMQHLQLEQGKETFPLISQCGLPAKVAQLKLHGSAPAFLHFSSVNESRVGSLSLQVLCNDIENMQSYFSAIDNIAARADRITSVAFTVNDHSLIEVPDNVACTCLTTFTSNSAIKMRTVMLLAQRISSLARITVTLIIDNDDFDKVYIFDNSAVKRSVVTPFNSNIETLDLDFYDRNSNIFIHEGFAKHLILALPNLKRFFGHSIPMDAFRCFIRSFKTQYPHLENISLN